MYDVKMPWWKRWLLKHAYRLVWEYESKLANTPKYVIRSGTLRLDDDGNIVSAEVSTG